MNYFTKNRLLFWGIVLLVLMNVSSLATVWYQQRQRAELPQEPMRPPRDVADFLKRRLELSPAQAEEMVQLQQQHFQTARTLRNEIRELKQSLFDELTGEAADSARVDSIAAQIGRKHSELEKLTFYHFRDIRCLCPPEKKKHLEALMHDVFHSRGPHHRKRRHRDEMRQPGPPPRPEAPLENGREPGLP